MNIALPILLLVFGGLTFWLLSESSIRWHLKAACIFVFCAFTIIFWSSIHTFLGWPALEDDFPDKVVVHWVIIKEPNKHTGYDGRIFLLLETGMKPDPNFLARFFGYRKEKLEPRLYGLEYSRGLHEQLQKQVIPRLRKGQPVTGRLSKGKGKNGDGEKGKAGSKKGDGSESQEQEWRFHELLPSDTLDKDE